MGKSSACSVYETGTRVRFLKDTTSENGWVVTAGTLGVIKRILPKVAVLLDECGPDNEEIVALMSSFILSEELEKLSE